MEVNLKKKIIMKCLLYIDKKVCKRPSINETDCNDVFVSKVYVCSVTVY